MGKSVPGILLGALLALAWRRAQRLRRTLPPFDVKRWKRHLAELDHRAECGEIDCA